MILGVGRHRDPSEGRCLLELVSMVAGEPWSDHPCCVHPVLGSIARRVNDACSDAARDELLPLAVPLIGTASAPVSALLVARCARAALSVRPDLRRLTRRRWPARSFVADAITVLAENAESADQRLVALLGECVEVTNGTFSLLPMDIAPAEDHDVCTP
ncbi:MAG TPA: hypothetical protein VGN81_12110 [Pseudonocardiaceae bacterium]|jgi:hypothetical protein